MKLKIEYTEEDLARLVEQDLLKRFPGQVATGSVDPATFRAVEVAVTLNAVPQVVAPLAAPVPPPAPIPTLVKVAAPVHDPDAVVPLPPPPRLHAEKPFDPTGPKEVTGIEAWGVKPRG